MLERITIRNLALISDAELEFSDKLNVLSGETGAGKSIIVDALMLLMGGKYDKTMLSYGTESGYVEGLFTFVDESKTTVLDEYGLERDSQLIVSRKFSADGKNDIRINGKTVTAKMLKSIMSHFVDICGQNEYQVLGNKREHAYILDAYLSSDLSEELAKLGEKFKEYCDIKKKIAAIGNADERLQRIDILKYQIDEIERAEIRDGEEAELLEFRTKATHGEKIKLALGGAVSALTGENCGTDKIYEALRSLSQIGSLTDEYGNLSERLGALSIELDDISATLSDMLSDVDFDERDLERAETRLSRLRVIKKKYGELSSLPDKLGALRKELDLLTGSDEEYDYLCGKVEKVKSELYDLCICVSDIRRKGATRLEADVKRELSTLGMNNSEFKVAFARIPDIDEFDGAVTSLGADDEEFMLSANLGQPLLPLAKIISGGEMSRFMLALKVVLSKYGSIETMIFDEIDTGISGKIGQEVAKKLADISRNSQVLCVTHLPQIASMADSQYFIEKQSDGHTTSTNVRLLDRSGIIDEITRLSGARDISSAARQTAIELKEWSDNYKNRVK